MPLQPMLHSHAGQMQVQQVSQEQLEKELADRQVPLIIDFYATWCGPCVLLAKELEQVRARAVICATRLKALSTGVKLDIGHGIQVAAELGDKVKVLKIDTDQNPELSSQLQVRSITRLDNSISFVADV